MEHELAIKNQAVERYILGEMKPEEREAFEEHFFSCAWCAQDVRATSAFVEEAKSIFKERPRWKKRSRVWFSWHVPLWAYAAATLLCLAVIGYQNFAVIPELKAPQASSSVVIFDGLTRGALPKLREGEALHFQMAWDGGGPASAELRRGSKTLSSGALPAPPPNQSLEIYFPVKVTPGRYSVVVRALTNGQPAKDAIENQFEVIPQETKTK